MGEPEGQAPGRGRAVRDTGPDPDTAGRDVHAMNQDDMVVYEAIATVRRPMSVGDVAVTTGLGQDRVRASLARLAERDIIVEGREGVEVGPNDWDVRGAR